MGLLEFHSPKTAASAKHHYYLMLSCSAMLLLAFLAVAMPELWRDGGIPATLGWMLVLGAMFSLVFAHIYRIEHRFLAAAERRLPPY